MVRQLILDEPMKSHTINAFTAELERKTGVIDKNQLAENAETCNVSQDSEPSGNKHLREVKEQKCSFFCSSSSTLKVNFNTTNIMYM